MALQTKDFSVTAKSGHGKITYTYTIRVTEESIDPVQNCSQVTVQAILQQTYSGTAFSGYRTGVSCDIDGENIFSDYCRRTIAGRQEHIFYTWTGQLPHSADGTRTITLSGRLWQTTPADYTPPTMEIPEGVMTLTPIVRASQVGASDALIGGRTTVVITPADPAFTHTLAFRFWEETGYITQNGDISPEPVLLSGHTVSFLIPERFYQQIQDQAWDNCSLVCATYDGETLIGTHETTFRISTEEDRCRPLVQVRMEDVNPDTLALTADSQVLIRHMSCLRVHVQAEGAFGAWIIRKSVNGQLLTDPYVDIPQVQNPEISVTALDSRRYSTTLQQSLPVIPYVKLTNNAAVSRAEPGTGQAVITFAGNCYRGSFGAVDNSLVLRWRICPENGEFGPWQTQQAQIREDHTYSAQVILQDLDYTLPHRLQTQAVDALDTAQTELTILPGIPVFHWEKDKFFFHVPVQCDESIAGAYIRTWQALGQTQLTLTMEPEQTVFLFGGKHCGILSGDGSWWGSDLVTAGREAQQTHLFFPEGSSGTFLLISAQPFCIE